MLEPRHLLALDIAFNDGILEIHSDHHDDIIVTARAHSVMINGEHPEGRCIVADQVRQIHANGGLLSNVDLSAVRRNRDAFSQVELMTRSAASEAWLREVAGVEKAKFDQLFSDLYSDPAAASRGVSWPAKLDWIDQALRDDGVSDLQLDWIRQYDFFPANKMAYYNNLAAERAESDALGESESHALPVDMSAAEGEDNCTPIYVDAMGISVSPPFAGQIFEEDDGYARLKVQAPGHTCGINPFSVDYETIEVTAVDGDDYIGQMGTLTWADGEEGEIKYVDVPIIDDTIDEPNENFDFQISNLQNFDGDECDVSMGNDLITATIRDDDPMPKVSILGDPSVPEDAGSVTLDVELDHPSGYPITVNWATEADTATADVDYVEDDDILYFAPGETSKQITVAIIDDEIDEWDETFKVKLTYADYAIEDDWQSIVTIVDEDPLPNLYIESVTVPETIGDAEVRTWIDRETEKQAYADYDTQEFTALANWDYTPRSGVVSFPEYLEDYIHIPIVDDPYAEWDETFHVMLSQPTNLNIVTSQGNVTIISDDPDPDVVIGDDTVTEGDPGDDTIAWFPVSLSAASGKPITVSAQTSDGTALAGEDYEATTYPIVFELSPYGPQITESLSDWIPVPIIEDVFPEETEEFYVSLVSIQNASSSDPEGIGTINDDDSEIDIDAYKIHHNQKNGLLDDSGQDEEEEVEGAYLPVNDDDDDYDADNLPDYQQPGGYDKETDLLPIKLNKLEKNAPGATFTIEIPSHVKVWKNDDRTDQVTPSTPPFDANTDTELYVEGTSVGSGLIKMNLHAGGKTLSDGDRIKVTTFQWSGPLNVPGHTNYVYEAVSGHATEGQWLEPVYSGAHLFANGAPGQPDFIFIGWLGGPEVGKAVYQARQGYVWDLEVNVVEIKLSSDSEMNKVTLPAGWPMQLLGPNTAQIVANGADEAIVAKLAVERVKGPLVDGVERGKKFMKMGFSQQATVEKKRGYFDDSTPPQQQASSLEDGQVHWDLRHGGTEPWVHIDALHYLDITDDGTNVSNYQFETTDNPILLGVKDFVLADDKVDRLEIIVDFWTYFVVVSKDPRILEPEEVRTVRAEITWRQDSSGAIQDATGIFTFTGTRTSSPQNDQPFVEVISGERLPDAETNINSILQGGTEGWQTGPQ